MGIKYKCVFEDSIRSFVVHLSENILSGSSVVIENIVYIRKIFGNFPFENSLNLSKMSPKNKQKIVDLPSKSSIFKQLRLNCAV